MALSSGMRHPVLPMVAAVFVLTAVEPARTQAPPTVRDMEARRPNEVAAVVAGTWESEGRGTFPTLGVEYERRITSRVGLIAEVEYLFDAESWVVAAPLVFQPARGVKLFGGPGFEHAQSEQDESLELPRVQGQRWRHEARTLLAGLGEAIDVQFTRWNLTEAEREVALLLLKGLSLKDIAAVRGAAERTIRAQTQTLYAKAGVTGRAALSAFFLEDLLAPIAAAGDDRA